MPVRNVHHVFLPFVLLSLSITHPVAAHAASRREISVAAMSLDRAIAILAQQTGVDIGGAESGMGRIATRGVHGRLTVAAALDRLLAGTPFVAKQLAPDSFRIVRRPPPPPRPSRPVRAIPPPPVEPAPEIVVTATKRDTARLRFPGALTVLRPGGSLAFGDEAADGMDQAIAATPILQSTALGTGRNKLFIRGVADSSFTGPTQTTANVYFGEVPVAYNGPDPGLNLYDVDQVEVLEGPQGTLYGAGAIGGILRLVPHAVDLSQVAANIAGGIATTKSGEPGGDIAAMVNLPISTGVLGLRAVGYQVAEGGYIDDVRRGLHDVNGTTTTGARIDLRAAPADGWTLDAGVVAQWVSARDLQYAERGLPVLSRASLLAQPYDQRYLLGRVVVDKRWKGGLHLVSATGIVSRDADSRFDATRPARPNAPIAYDTEERSRLLSHETRLSRTGANGAGWLMGFVVIHASDIYARAYGAPDRLRPITGVTNRTLDTALFGEIGMALSPSFTLTTGARITHQRTDGDPIDGQRPNSYIRGRSVTRIDPTIGASWLVAPSVAAYARYQSGFRTGGITVAPGIGRVADLKPDTIRVTEIGIHKDRRGPLGLAGSVGLSLTDWRNIQADLVDRLGFPFTANIGDSRIRGVEASANWVPLTGLRFDLAMFFNDTAVAAADAATRYKTGVRLPNTPPFALSAGVGYQWSIHRNGDAGISAGWRYVGRSTVGTQAPLDVSQGEFGSAHLGGVWTTHKLRLTATLDNVFEVNGDRFAGGNPFVLAMRNEYTPLRPRTFRLGGSVSW